MTENKPITNIIFDNLNQSIKNIGEKCLNFKEQNKNLKEQLARKTQECEELKEKIENYCYDCDVAERMAKVTYAATGGRLSYSNYTVEAIEQAYNDQLLIDVEYRTKELEEQLKQSEQKLERITNMLFTGKCSNCEGYSPNCSNKELCNFKHNIKNIIDEVE